MAGSDHSGQDMEAGRVNRVEDRTVIWAQEEDDRGEFVGEAILVVEAARDIDDSDTFQRTSKTLHAIVGRGNNDGAGIVGLDDINKDHNLMETNTALRNGRLGIYARGLVGALGEGTEGPGLEGHGAKPGSATAGVGTGGKPGMIAPHSAGVFGRGGGLEDETAMLHGPGVLGIGGFDRRETASEWQLPPNTNVFGSAGVAGQGSAGVAARDPDGVRPGAERRAPGAGVVGRGGSIPNEDGGVGVIGFSGKGSTDFFQPLTNTGVYGEGPTGVRAQGTDGPGIFAEGSSSNSLVVLGAVEAPGIVGKGGSNGFSDSASRVNSAGVVGLAGDQPVPAWIAVAEVGVFGIGSDGVQGRGGVFQSGQAAQVRLIPTRRPLNADRVGTTPAAIANPGTAGPELPANGRAGDLMATIDQRDEATLWFCVQDAGPTGAARWAQVLLGPSFGGRA